MAKNSKILLPKNISNEAQQFVDAVISNLKKNDKLDKIDTASLYILTKACDTYIKANEHLDLEGLTFTSDRGNISISPYFKIARDSEKTILMLLTEYGCTLRSRQKLKGIDAEVEDSPLMQFINESKEL